MILDVMLPGISGFDVVSKMRESGQFVPTLILTARGHAEDVLQGFAAGADDYLTKPFELSILIARIRGLLRRREWLRATVKSPAGAAQRLPLARYLNRRRFRAYFYVRRKIGGLRPAGVARARAGIPAHPDGGERSSLSHRERGPACIAQNDAGECMGFA